MTFEIRAEGVDVEQVMREIGAAIEEKEKAGLLTDEEIREVDAFIRANTLERFGPVRTVKPELVFELGFEGLQRSKRHKSGIAVRFPRMLRMRKDKTPSQANTVEDAVELLEAHLAPR